MRINFLDHLPCHCFLLQIYVSSILDLGGGGGWLGLYIKKSYKQVKEYDIEIDSVKNHLPNF